MTPTKKMRRLMERMAAVERMERGSLCQMTGRLHYNHQTWRDGRNEVRYVPQHEVADLKEDIAGYHLFVKLAEQYADEVIRITRLRRSTQKRTPRPKS